MLLVKHEQDETRGVAIDAMYRSKIARARAALHAREQALLDERATRSHRQEVWLVNDQDRVVAIDDRFVERDARLVAGLALVHDRQPMCIRRLRRHRAATTGVDAAAFHSIRPLLERHLRKPH